MDSQLHCPQCLKSEALCICRLIQPFLTQTHVLFLQHPQEPNEELSSTRIAHLALPHSSLKIGLSWPNLRAALGEGWTQPSRLQPSPLQPSPLQPSHWAVLYLGSGVKTLEIEKIKGTTNKNDKNNRNEKHEKHDRNDRNETKGGKGTPFKATPSSPTMPQSSLQFVDRKGIPLPPPPKIQGIVILDGTWSQAKALWWRNPWLLKLKRAVLTPSAPSLYRELRKEPRRECLSTIEATAEALSALGEIADVSQGLRALFIEFLKNYRARKNSLKK